MMVDYEKTIQYIMLARIRGLGPVGQHEVLKVLRDPARCFADEYEVKRELKACGCPKRYIDILLQNRKDKGLRDYAESLAKKCDNKGVRTITASDPDYPIRFRGIPEMPKVMYSIGKLKINDFRKSVGIIGARRCTHEGKALAISLAEELAAEGAAVISGMAKGIDSYAHTAVVKSNGYTIAVLGHGPDLCYPEEHAKLYESICDTGCILSEIPPEVKPRQYMFPRRNRIIAALSDELYVVDAGRHSGTESTVEAARKYNRIVIRDDEV